MSDKPKVGEILVQAGVIDEMQLSSALGEQSRWGRRLGATLIKMGMVDEGQLVRALAQQLDLPIASLAGKRISDDVIALVPMRVASEHGVIPLFVKKQGRTTQLFLGMEDPSNLAVLDDLSFRTGMELHPVMVGPSEIWEAMDRYYLRQSAAPSAGEIPGERTDERSGSPAGEAMGEQSLHGVAEFSPISRDTRTELQEAVPMLAEGLLEDVADAVEESQKTRVVARALVHLLIEKGIFTLEELQAQIAQKKGGEIF